MDSASITMIAALVFLVVMSAYFSATETAFSSLNRVRMKSKADGGNQRAALALELEEDYDRLLSTILIGNNIVNITATTVSTVLFTKLLPVYGPTVSTVVLTVIIRSSANFSEGAWPRRMRRTSPCSPPPFLRVFIALLRPVNFLFTQWKRLLTKLLRKKAEDGITEEELITMVDQAEDEGGLDQHESQLIRAAIEFNDLEVEEILTPRVDVVAVEDTDSMDEIARTFAENGYSRLPVYHEDIDDIVGVIHEKDFHAARYHGREDVPGNHQPGALYHGEHQDLTSAAYPPAGKGPYGHRGGRIRRDRGPGDPGGHRGGTGGRDLG